MMMILLIDRFLIDALCAQWTMALVCYGLLNESPLLRPR